MRIERLENSKHKQERVLVYLEDGTLLRITGAELLRFGLYQGLDLPPETLEELKQVINDNVSTSIMQIQLDGKGLEDYQENVTIEWYCLQ